MQLGRNPRRDRLHQFYRHAHAALGEERTLRLSEEALSHSDVIAAYQLPPLQFETTDQRYFEVVGIAFDGHCLILAPARQ